MKGMIIVLSGPSGGGKTTLGSFLKKIFPEMYHSVSCTTRSKRPGESKGKDYSFVSLEDFEKKKKENEFAEWAEVHGDLYGTPKKQLEDNLNEGRDVLLDIDIQGAEEIRKLYPDGLFIFIMPPSIKVLRERLKSRKTEDKDVIKKRLKLAKKEVKKRVVEEEEEKKQKEIEKKLKQAEEEMKQSMKQVKNEIEIVKKARKFQPLYNKTIFNRDLKKTEQELKDFIIKEKKKRQTNNTAKQ